MSHPFLSLGTLLSGMVLLAAGEIPGIEQTTLGPLASLGGVGVIGWLALTLLKEFRAESAAQRAADEKRSEKFVETLTAMRVHCAVVNQQMKAEQDAAR